MKEIFTRKLQLRLLVVMALLTGFSGMAQYSAVPQIAGESYVALTDGGTPKDQVGNDAPLVLSTPADLTQVRVKTDQLTVTVTMSEPSPINHAFTVTFTFSDPVTGFDNSDLVTSALTTITPVTSVDGGKTYTATVTTTLQGPGFITVSAGAAQDMAGNSNQEGRLDFVYDVATPVILGQSIPSGTYRTGSVITVTITFSEPVLVTGAPFINLAIGSKTRKAEYNGGTGTTVLTFSYTVVAGDLDNNGVAIFPITLGGGTIKDPAGNNAALGASITFPTATVDAVAPVITSVPSPTFKQYKEGDVISITVQMSKNVAVTGTPALGIMIGSKAVQAQYKSGSGTSSLVFEYTVVRGDNDDDGIELDPALTLNGGTIRDMPGNDAELTLHGVGATTGVIVNAVRPGVTITPATPSPYNNAFNITIEFTEAVTDDLVAASFDFAGGAVSDIRTSDHKTWTAIFRPFVNVEGSGHIQVKADVVHNAAGNGNVASDVYNFNYDTKPPSVVSYPRPADGTYRAGDVLRFTYTFDESLVITGSPVLPVIIGANTRNVPLTSNTANTLTFSYTIVPGEEDLDGIDQASIGLNGGTITDALNNNARIPAGNTNFPLVLVDAVPPEITSVAVPLPGYYKNGNVLNFTVTFSENVTVTRAPVLDINIGGVTRHATSSGITANSLSFSYTIQPGDQDLDGITLDADLNLSLNNAVITDVAGNNLYPVLHGIGNTANVYVYSVVPAITFEGVVVTAPFTLRVIFSEKVTGFDISDIQVTNATLTAFNTTDNVTYTVLLTPITQGQVSIKVPANAAVNIAGTGNAAAPTLYYYYDGTPPTITSVDVPANGYYKAGDVLTFTVHYSENVNVLNTVNEPLLPVIIGSKTAPAKYVSGGGTNGDLVFSYTVVDGDMDLDGIELGTELIISSGGAVIHDPSGNNAALTIHNPANTSQVRVNTARPSISITSGATQRVNAAFTGNIDFSEEVTGFDIGDIVVTNGTLSNLHTSNNTNYTVTITPGTDGPVTISVPATVAVNNAGNYNTASNTLSRTADKTSPVVNAATFSVNNDAPAGTVVGQVSATDASGVVQDWTITGDGSGGAFAIDANGNITVKDAAILDSRAGTTVTLSVRVSDGLNNSAPAAIAINVMPAYVNKTPTLDAINNESICTGTDVHTIQLNGPSAVEPGQTYTITATSDKPYFDELSVSAANVFSYKLKSSVMSGTAIISVTIKDDGGTANGAVDQLTRNFTITVNSVPAITITSDKGTTVFKGDVIHLTATGGSTYAWADAPGIISGRQSAVLEVKANNNATYEVTATSAAGCTGTASISITTGDDFKVDATNILTPNGDGRNDKWVIRNLDAYPNNEVQVFDRAGRLVFQRRSYANDWDGIMNGKPLAEGTYYYILRINDGAKTAKGYITIIRDEQ